MHTSHSPLSPTEHFKRNTLHCTMHTSHSPFPTLYTSQWTLHTLKFSLQITLFPHSTLSTAHCTLHISTLPNFQKNPALFNKSNSSIETKHLEGIPVMEILAITPDLWLLFPRTHGRQGPMDSAHLHLHLKNLFWDDFWCILTESEILTHSFSQLFIIF